MNIKAGAEISFITAKRTEIAFSAFFRSLFPAAGEVPAVSKKLF